MTRFIVEYLSKKENQESKFNQLFCLDRSISYVFCSDKDSRHTDSLAVIHSILYQTLLRYPRLLRCISQEYLKSPQAFMADPEAAWECLSAILQHGRNLQFLFVIDALDELPDKARIALILGMQKLVTRDLIGRLKVIITDRRDSSLLLDPKFPMESNFVDLDSEMVVRQDVKAYLEAAVRSFCEEHEFPEQVLEKVRTELIARSNGLFLLASLHFTTFCHGVSYWTPDTVSQKLEEIQQVPATVESLYCQLLNSVPLHFQSSLRTIFTWVLAAREPLKVADLKYAISIKSEHQSYEDVEKCIGFNFAAVLRRFCGAFLKITECEEIQFRHQSFKDLLLNGCSLQDNDRIIGQYKTTFEEREYTVSSLALRLLHWKEFASSVQIHEIVISKAVGKSQPGFPDRPLLWYCCRHWPHHYRYVQDNPKLAAKVAQYVSSTQGNYFCSLGVNLPAAIRTKFKSSLTFRKYTPPLSLLCHYGDFPSVAEHLVHSTEDANQPDSLGMSPLHWTLALGRVAIGSLLMSLPRIAINCGSLNGDKPIHATMYNHSNFAVFQAFLKDQRVDVNSKGANDKTALHLIIAELSKLQTWLDPLLARTDLDLNPRDESGITPFIQALSKGDGRQVAFRLLQEPLSKLDITACDKNGTNALSLASMRGWTDVRRLIQGRDKSQAFSIADDGMNALTRSAFWGQKQMLKTLIRDCSKSDVRHLANQGRFNLLNLCAQQDWEDVIIDLHTRYRLESLDQDDQGRTLLHWAAASCWSYSFAPHSVQQRARINIQDRDGKTALHLAAESRNFEAAKSLLSQGADILAKDKYGKNPVHVAADSGAKAVLLEFLKTSHRDFGRDNEGRSLLHFISTWEWPKVLEEYVSTKRPIVDVLDYKRHTPLHYAAIYGTRAILEAFIQYGVIIDRRDSSGLTALHHAIQQNHTSIARTLVDSGADIKKLDGFRRSCYDLSLRTGGNDIIRFISGLGTDLSIKYPSGVRALDETEDMEKEQYKTTVSVSLASHGEDDLAGPTSEGDEINKKTTQATIALLNTFPSENCRRDGWALMFEIFDDEIRAEYVEARSKRRLRITDMLVRLLIEQGFQFQELDGVKLDFEDQCPKVDACYGIAKSDPAIEFEEPKPKEIEHLDATEFLQLAAEQGEKRLLRVLIQQGFPLNGTCRHGWTALHQASSHNQLEALQLLLESGANTEVAQVDSRLTALHIAAIRGNTDTVRALLEHGADLNKNDVHGWKALHFAVANGHYLLVQLILEHDADAVRAAEGHTSLLVLCLTNESLTQLLLAHGADPDGREGDRSLLELVSRRDIFSLANGSGSTTHSNFANYSDFANHSDFVLASRSVQHNICGLLLKYSKDAITSMLRAMIEGGRRSFSTLLPLYLDWSEGLLPSFSPFAHCHLEQSLLYHWFNNKVRLYRRRYQIHPLSNSEEREILRLCAIGSDPNFGDGMHDTPMHLAIHYPDMLTTLSTKGGKLSVVDKEGNTPLHTAVAYRRLRSVEILLQKGADSNAQNNNGETPLHLVSWHYYACRVTSIEDGMHAYEDAVDILILLLKYGADPNIQSLGHKVFGVVVPETAMDLTKRVQDLELVRVLEEHAKQRVLSKPEDGVVGRHE